MPSYAQLQAEPWWGREVVTPEFDWFHGQVAVALGVPHGNVGSKGDNRHLNGAHRSQEWILNSRWCTNRTYTVQPGLTADQLRHLAGCDITPKSRDQMLWICRNLDREVRAGRLEEVREWYGNTDNDQRVDGYNNVANRVASSDVSHLWHLHLTFDRRALRNLAAMRRVLAALLGGTTPDTPASQEDDVDPLQIAQINNAERDGAALRELRDMSIGISNTVTAADRPHLFVQAFKKLAADVADLKDRPAGTVALTPTDRDAIVTGLVGGLVGSPAFLAAVAKAVADENARRQKD